MNEKKKLTDEEIVKALECCVKEEHKDCGHCGEFVSQFDCMRNAISNALDLIHRGQADNIQLKWNYVDLKERHVKVLDLNEKVIAQQQAEIERLTERENELVEDKAHWINKWKEQVGHNEELQKQVDELTEERYYTEQDTAKEIFDDLRNIFIEQSSYGCDANQHIGYYDNEMKISLVVEQIDEYAKEKYGIEYGAEVE